MTFLTQSWIDWWILQLRRLTFEFKSWVLSYFELCMKAASLFCWEWTLIKHISFIYAAFSQGLCDRDKAGYSTKCKQLALRQSVNKLKKWTNCWVRSLWVPRHSFQSKFVFQNLLCDIVHVAHIISWGLSFKMSPHTMRFLFDSLNLTTLIVQLIKLRHFVDFAQLKLHLVGTQFKRTIWSFEIRQAG